MAFRFQKRVSLFPGVRLNFSSRGVSTTLGVRGASINIGSRGAYLNVGLPGTGLSYRTRLSKTPFKSPESNSPPRDEASSHEDQPNYSSLSPQLGAIRSAATAELTSAGLSELKRLINEAAVRRTELKIQTAGAKTALEKSERRLKNARRFIIRIFTRNKISSLISEIDNAKKNLDEAELALQGCAIDVDFAFDDTVTNAFAALARTYDELTNCETVWDITNFVSTNRAAERTIATSSINRIEIRLSSGQSEIMHSSQRSLHFENANGDDLYLYSGFALLRNKIGDFALIEMQDVAIHFEVTRFVEEDRVPSDTEIVGQTWKKANKDGSPDLRFSGNFQIPLTRYGKIFLKNRTGLNEAYLFSNASKAEAFAESFADYSKCLKRFSDSPASSSPNMAPEAAAEPERQESEALNSSSLEPEKRSRYVIDWIAFLALVFVGSAAGGIGYDAFTKFNGPSTSASSVRSTAIQPLAPMPDAKAPATPVGTLPPAIPLQTPPTILSSSPQRLPVAVSPLEVGYVQKPNVNVRQGPSQSASIVSTVAKGTKFSVHQRQGDWVQIGDASPIGWIHSTLIGSRDLGRN